MKIGNFDLHDNVFIVAEIGNNHEGNFQVACKLVHEAAKSGVDAVKFQTFRTEYYVSKSDVVRFNRLKSFELTNRQFEELAALARSLGLYFISTPFDLDSAAFLEHLVDAYKIASGDSNYYPLISHVVKSGKPTIISSGLSDFSQVARTVQFVKTQWPGKNPQLALLHCVSSYPVPPEQANLRAIQFMRERLDVHIGYSDHTIGIDAAVLAVALGARIIEKHFTLDKNFSDFRDHQLSADPIEMRNLVTRIRLASSMLGEFQKNIQPCEKENIKTIRRSIVANGSFPLGHRIASSDLTWIRPSGGLAPGEEDRLIGKTLKRSVQFGEQLRESDVE